MSSGVIKRPGRAPTRSEQLLLNPLIERKFPGYIETVVIHHITEDTTYRLQLEIERRISRTSWSPDHGVSTRTKCLFERIWI